MHKFFAESVDDIEAALKIRPRLSIGYATLVGEARGQHDLPQLKDLRARALQQVPASFAVREQLIESLYPRWGGSQERMAAFAQHSQALAGQNPNLHWLLGFVDLDEGETLGLHGENDKSIVAFTDAIRKGGDYSLFYFDRGIAYAEKGSYPEGLRDFNRADQLSPQDPELLIRRAWVLAKLDQPTLALADLDLVKTFEQPDETWTQLHPWAVSASSGTTH